MLKTPHDSVGSAGSASPRAGATPPPAAATPPPAGSTPPRAGSTPPATPSPAAATPPPAVATHPTVATKLAIPPPAHQLLERGRLLDVLDEGVNEGLVLLSAPAGAGKTVLLSSWIAARTPPGPPCWLSLDREDNDASRLLADLLSALRASTAIEPGSELDRLAAPVGARGDRFLALLVNGLAELRSPVLLVLDDTHELTSSEATAALDFLVRHAPAQLRIVLAGRADPPLPIERLRVSGALTELRAAELAFDRSETAELCERLELTLSARDIDSLWTRTEGWPAAVRLAAVSLRGHPEPARFLAELVGSDRAVADYLVSEVLARLPQEQREFMLRTCLVDAVSAELADALTELEDGTVTLAALEHLGAPVQPADAEGRWYRYHPLFRELLRAHLRHAHPQEVPRLHRRAARWYAGAGQVTPAVRHALAGEDWEQAGELIAAHWLDLFLCGRSAAMREPMARLPPAVLEADPRLAAAFAGSRLQDGDLREAERHLAIARRTHGEAPAPARDSLDTTLAAVALHHARLRVRMHDAERFARRLTSTARARTHHRWASLRGFALANLGATRLWSGDPQGATDDLHEGLALATEHRHEYIALDCLAQLSLVHVLRGELTRAEQLSRRAVDLAERRGWSEGPAAACAHLASAMGAHQRGELERAEGSLARAASAAETAEPPVRLATGLMQALVLAAAGPHSAARGTLKLRAVRAELADGAPAPDFLRVALDDAEPRVLLAAGEPGQARAALAEARARAPACAVLLVRQASLQLHDGELELARESLAQARRQATDAHSAAELRLAVGLLSTADPQPAAELQPAVGLHPVTDPHPATGLHPATELEGCLLQALVDHATGDLEAASRVLERALALAEREPFRDAFLLHGEAARKLLELQARHGTAHPALLEVLLDGVERPAPDAALAEPLTERELAILRYLPTMLTNAEIGAEVCVSLNTVKTHLRSIYRKLDACGRADAVERARRLGLLPAGIQRPRVVARV